MRSAAERITVDRALMAGYSRPRPELILQILSALVRACAVFRCRIAGARGAIALTQEPVNRSNIATAVSVGIADGRCTILSCDASCEVALLRCPCQAQRDSIPSGRAPPGPVGPVGIVAKP